MNVSLTPELEQLIHLKVETGRYNSASEVVREALRLMAQRDELQTLHKEEIRKQIAAGMASLRSGNSVDGEIFLAEIDSELAKFERQGRE
ncbi:MAG: antitoxin ParD1/3/4 [Aliidongia sp.]|jgi:antitoxin ParD1/3/4|nr:antitoxin ParD1/3/4 [Aliidongia sp.]